MEDTPETGSRQKQLADMMKKSVEPANISPAARAERDIATRRMLAEKKAAEEQALAELTKRIRQEANAIKAKQEVEDVFNAQKK